MLVSKLTDTFMTLSESLSGFLSEGQSMIMSAKLFDQISTLLEDTQLSERLNELREKLLSLLETRENSGVASQIRDLSQTLVNIVEEGQKSVSPQLFDLHDRLTSTVVDFQKQLDLIVKYDWDFDHYLEEDVPTAVRCHFILMTFHMQQVFVCCKLVINIEPSAICKWPASALR
ncbi:unnamed protein product [Linum tenue]|uniref:Uncharacterized protein n=1 Tax=Linum tenue TaxID=586396 RepID=A0AAV0MYN1_9ROSI|nr:unnamed protein product [Linum tenue]